MDDQNGDSAVSAPQPGHADDEALALVFQAGSNEEAEVVRATLSASGIKATLISATVNPVLGGLDSPMRDTAGLGVFVLPEDVEAARAVLSAAPPTEEELSDEAMSAVTAAENSPGD